MPHNTVYQKSNRFNLYQVPVSHLPPQHVARHRVTLIERRRPTPTATPMIDSLGPNTPVDLLLTLYKSKLCATGLYLKVGKFLAKQEN